MDEEAWARQETAKISRGPWAPQCCTHYGSNNYRPTPRTYTGWGLLYAEGVLLTHGGDDGDEEVLSVVKHLLDLVSELALWELDVVLRDALVGHEVEEAVVDVDELVFGAGDVGDVHVVGRGGEVLELFVGEDIDRDEVDLGVSVLAGL